MANAGSVRGGSRSCLLLTWLAEVSGTTSPREVSPVQPKVRPLAAVGQAKPPAVAGGCASPKRRREAERRAELPEKDRKGMVTLSGQGKHELPLPANLRGARGGRRSGLGRGETAQKARRLRVSEAWRHWLCCLEGGALTRLGKPRRSSLGPGGGRLPQIRGRGPCTALSGSTARPSPAAGGSARRGSEEGQEGGGDGVREKSPSVQHAR